MFNASFGAISSFSISLAGPAGKSLRWAADASPTAVQIRACRSWSFEHPCGPATPEWCKDCSGQSTNRIGMCRWVSIIVPLLALVAIVLASAKSTGHRISQLMSADNTPRTRREYPCSPTDSKNPAAKRPHGVVAAVTHEPIASLADSCQRTMCRPDAYCCSALNTPEKLRQVEKTGENSGMPRNGRISACANEP